MKRLTTTTVALFALGGLLAGCAGDAAQDQDQDEVESPDEEGTSPSDDASPSDDSEAEYDPITIRFPVFYGPEHWQSQNEQAFADAIEENSNGQITVEFHYAGSLVAPQDMPAAVRDGLVEMARIVPVYDPASFPLDNWIAGLASYANATPMTGTFQAAAGSIEWGFENEASMAELTDQGLFPLLPQHHSLTNYHLLCAEPVSNLDAASGKRVRTGGPAWAAEVEALGMTSVTLTPSEIYEAFQRGVVDCGVEPVPNYVSGGHFEVAENLVMDPEVAFSGFTSNALVANQEWWDGLPVAAQRAIWDALPVAVSAWAQGFIKATLEGVEADISIIEMEQDMRDALTSWQDASLDRMLENPPPGMDEDQARETAEQWTEAYDRWYEIVVDDLGYEEAESWEAFLAAHPDGEVDTQPWIDRLWEEVLEPLRP